MSSLTTADILTIILGSGVISSILNAIYDYFSTQKFSEESRIEKYIFDIYLHKGLYVIEGAISKFGTTTTFAFKDMIKMVRNEIDYNKYLLKRKFQVDLKQLGTRPNIKKLMLRDYEGANEAFPRLQIFGMELYNAVKNTFDLFSEYIIDNIERENIIPSVNGMLQRNKDPENVLERIADIAKILQRVQMYIERRIRQLDEFVSLIKYQSYSKFQTLKETDEMKSFRSELKEFNDLQNSWKNNSNLKTSTDLSKWIYEHIDKNPLKKKY